MKKLILLLSLILSSCTSEGEQKLIPKDDFTKIHGEVLVIESYYQLKYRSVGIYKDSLKSSIDKLLKKFGYTFEQYERTYDYYAIRQKEFQQINSELIKSFNRKKL